MFWQSHTHSPMDNPAEGYPKLILIYTLWYAWVEGIIKVAQKKQTALDRDAMNRLHELLLMSEKRDKVLHSIIASSLERDKHIKEITEKIYELVELKNTLQNINKLEITSDKGKPILHKEEK